MIINHNMNALNAHRNMTSNTVNSGKSMEKLSSGLRINRAGDDAAGLSISEKMRGQIRGLDQASRNAQDGISMIQTAEGALQETHSILQRMRELSVQASNDTNNTDDRKAIGQELKDLTAEINRISKTTDFNGKKLLDGSLSTTQDATSTLKLGVATGDKTVVSKVDVSGALAGATYTFEKYTDGDNKLTLTRNDGISQTVDLKATAGDTQKLNFNELGISIELTGTNSADDIGAVIGAATGLVIKTEAGNAAASFAIGANGLNDEKMSVDFAKMDDTTLGTTATLKALISDKLAENVVTNQADADALTKSINESIVSVSEQRSKLGAAQNRLEHTINNLGTSSENLTAAESRVRDVDMAKEMMNFSKNNILSQAAQAMLAQANQQPQGVLQLLR